MKKITIIALLLLSVLLLLSACSTEEQAGQVNEEYEGDTVEDITSLEEIGDINGDDSAADIDEMTVDIDDNEDEISSTERLYYSPFTGKIVNEYYLRKALVVIVENSPAARPQSGLAEASIVYEVMAEGGITRFLALYWDEIPEKIGPVRSARPYMIEIAREYNAVLLHAGGSPGAYAMLAENKIDYIDQIYNGQYYWRSNDRKAPHNLYTGNIRIQRYLDRILGQEYEDRFRFQQVSFIKADDEKSDYINLPLWAGTTVIYKYNSQENQYYRYYGFMETPHLMDNNRQITAKNIIIQFAKTRQIDDVGRLEVDLEGRGQALLFRDGIVVEGSWEKDTDNLTKYYNCTGQPMILNPGQTWIEVIPDTIKVEYYSQEAENRDSNEIEDDLIGIDPAITEDIEDKVEDIDSDSLEDNSKNELYQEIL